MKLTDINIRDPFIMKYDGKYYMYGTRTVYDKPADSRVELGFDVYISEDLEEWSSAKSIFDYYDGFYGVDKFWAPEIHYYNGKFYMFATFKPEDGYLGTATLVCDTPDGRFVPNSDGPITPADWACLDGTLYVEDGVPYMVFCHEWTQIGSGTVCAVRLSEDLKCAVGEPVLLWSAGDAGWKYDMRDNGSYVTDGPYLIKRGGELISIWSSFCEGRKYCEAISRSDNGRLFGKWTIDEELMLKNDGGHGMIFTDYNGKEYFVYHTPNTAKLERPFIKEISVADLFKK